MDQLLPPMGRFLGPIVTRGISREFQQRSHGGIGQAGPLLLYPALECFASRQVKPFKERSAIEPHGAPSIGAMKRRPEVPHI